MTRNRKSQAAIEFVITVGFALMITIPLMILFYEHTNNSQEQISNSQAGLIARKLTDAANSVYYLGHPSILTLKVYMPERVQAVNFTGREAVLTLDDGNEIVSIANVNLTGKVRPGSGLKIIKISALENLVNISEDEN